MNALLMGAQITFIQEGCALDMGQRSNDAVAKDVQTLLRKEEYAAGMEQKSRSNYAVAMDVQTLFRKEECA